jgi:hypothetical protein
VGGWESLGGAVWCGGLELVTLRAPSVRFGFVGGLDGVLFFACSATRCFIVFLFWLHFTKIKSRD